MKVPGIVLKTGNFLKPDRVQNRSADIKFGDWLEASLSTRLQADQAIYKTPGGINVLFDGYLSDVNGVNVLDDFWNQPAQTIAELYRDHRDTFLSSLRGSFTCLIYDEPKDEALLFSDRRASRPLFYARDDQGSILAAPEIRDIVSVLQTEPKLNIGAAAEFLSSSIGISFSDHTLFQGISKFPQAGCLLIRKTYSEIRRYWNLHFSATEHCADEDFYIEKLDALLRQSLRRLLRIANAPFLFLSGGIDSRLVLAYLLSEHKCAIPIVTYKMSAGEGDDHTIARIIAEQCKLGIEEFEVCYHELFESIEHNVFLLDGRVDLFDTPSSFQICQRLSNKYRIYFDGQTGFDWKTNVKSIKEALVQVGLFRLNQVSRLRHWLNPKVRKDLCNHLNAVLSTLVKDTDETEPTNVEGKLFYEQRLGNMNNGHDVAMLRWLECAKPLADEDIVEFSATVPLIMRENKYLEYKALERIYPLLLRVPLSHKPVQGVALVFKSVLKEDTALSTYIRQELCDTLDPRLKELLDISRFTYDVDAILQDKPLSVVSGDWAMRVPGAWRFAFLRSENRIHPVYLMLKILQLNIYLKGLKVADLRA